MKNSNRIIANCLCGSNLLQRILYQMIRVSSEIVVVFNDNLVEVRQQGEVDIAEIDLDISPFLRINLV